MHDGDRSDRLQGPLHLVTRSQIDLHKGTPAHGPAVAGRQVVEHDGLETEAGQRLARVAPDVASATRDQNGCDTTASAGGGPHQLAAHRGPAGKTRWVW